MQFKKIILTILLFIFSSFCNSAITIDQGTPEPNGNFSLPQSQQPGPFYSFGQNVIGKKTLQVYLYPDYLKTSTGYSTEITPAVIYGITDYLSLLINLPVMIDHENSEHKHSSGTENSTLQAEYAFFNKSTKHYTQTATIIAGVYENFKLKSIHDEKSTELFFGLTFNQTWKEWLFFTSGGTLSPIHYELIRPGRQIYYQAGLGKNIISSSGKYSLLGLLELDGQYAGKNKFNNHFVPNTGENFIFLTPSIWFSTEQLILQVGASLPILQHWNGNQATYDYYLSAFLGWTFKLL